jgi:hypothetical protein
MLESLMGKGEETYNLIVVSSFARRWLSMNQIR